MTAINLASEHALALHRLGLAAALPVAPASCDVIGTRLGKAPTLFLRDFGRVVRGIVDNCAVGIPDDVVLQIADVFVSLCHGVKPKPTC